MRSRSTSYQRETCSSSPEHVRPARRPNGFGAARRGARVTAEGAPIGRRGESDAGEPRDGREPRACRSKALSRATRVGSFRRPGVVRGSRTTARAGQSGGGAPNRVSSRVPRRPGARAFVGPRDAARAPRANRTVAGASPRAPGSRETLDRGRAALAGARSRRRVEAKTGARARGGGHERAGGFGAVRLHDVHGTGGAAGGRERDETGRVAGRPRDGTDARQGVRAEVRAARANPISALPPSRITLAGPGSGHTDRDADDPSPPPNPPSPRSEPSDSDTDERAGRDGGPNGACCVVQ